MNLLRDPWITIRRRDGSEQGVAPTQITDPAIDAVDIVAPRPDFRGALYQFLIGLLQTAWAPRDIGEWLQAWECPPTQESLAPRFVAWAPAFELDPPSGPAFMQDLDELTGAELVDIAKLLIESPGDKTVQDSNDHFIHSGAVPRMCPRCAAVALFTLEINAPSGGAGHRVSLRGGGPLTTLRIPRDTPQQRVSLWKRLWSNVVPSNYLAPGKPTGREQILPWLAATRTSDPQGVGNTTPEDVHSLQAYWSMPRRIRIAWADAAPGACAICGDTSERCVAHYRTRPYGVNYAGAWVHPLTPYSYELKQGDLPLSIKGQRGGIAYRDWAGLALGNEARNPAAARVVSFFNSQGDLPADARDARLWCFGYDMDNMKSRCWYDGTLPLPALPPERLPELAEVVKQLLDVAGELAFAVRRAVGAATHPDGTGDPSVAQSFWQESESAFYHFLEGVVGSGPEDDQRLAELTRAWMRHAHRLAVELFDRRVLAVPIEQGAMRKTVQARAVLEKSFYGGKSKALRAWIAARTEDEAA